MVTQFIFEINTEHWPEAVVIETGLDPMVKTGRTTEIDYCFSCGRSDEGEELVDFGEAYRMGILRYVERDAPPPPPKECGYYVSWDERCEELIPYDIQHCEEHTYNCSQLRCRNDATHNCSIEMGGKECGRKWCDSHSCGGH